MGREMSGDSGVRKVKSYKEVKRVGCVTHLGFLTALIKVRLLPSRKAGPTFRSWQAQYLVWAEFSQAGTLRGVPGST